MNEEVRVERLPEYGFTMSEAKQLEYAKANFSQTMVHSLSSNNLLRLSIHRGGGRASLRSREIVTAMRYIPFGLAKHRGRQVSNYMTHTFFNRHSFGLSRYKMFFSQLLDSGFIAEQAARGIYFGVHVLLQDPAHLPDLPKAILRDFGTTREARNLDGVKLVTQLDERVWPYDIHSIRAQHDGCLHVSTPLMNAAGMEEEEFVKRLKAATNDALPDNSDSGLPDDYRIINLFLVIYDSIRGGGGPSGQLWLTSDVNESTEWILNPKAIIRPHVSVSDSMCFWECLMHALILRERAARSIVTTWYIDMIEPAVRMNGRNGSRVLKQTMMWVKNNVHAFWTVACTMDVLTGMTTCPTSAEVCEDIGHIFGFKDVSVLGSDGIVLFGECDTIHRLRAETGGLLLILSHAHFSLVTSYTSLLPVKECPTCGARFNDTSSLGKHLADMTCLKCECLSLPGAKRFESIADWQAHRRCLNQCPFRLLPPTIVVKTMPPRERHAKRFPHDASSKKHYGKYNGGPRQLKEQNMMEHDHASIRNDKEALFVDIESIVPHNGYVDSRYELNYQEPYAIGWLKRTDALLLDEPTIVYGMDCIERFFEYLDAWYELILVDETCLWEKRARKGLEFTLTPKVIRGFKNYPSRLKTSWDTLIKECKYGGECRVCGEELTTDHGYTVTMAEGNKEEFHFSDCCIRWWAKHAASKNLVDNFNDNAPRVSVWAHNGGRYDWIFIHRYLMEHDRLRGTHVTRGNAKYYEIAYRGVFLFRDSLNFMMASLDKLGKDFNVQTLKGIFPYRFLTSHERIDAVVVGESEIRDVLPPGFFEISELIPGPMGMSKKRALNESEYRLFFEERSWVYDVKTETIKYLAADIKCLQQVMETFRDGWKAMPYEPELFKYCTIGQMCHSYFLDRYLPDASYPVLDTMEDTFIRKALYGGRTEVFQRLCHEPMKPIHYVDVNSLYPFVMESCAMPTGEPDWFLKPSDERFAAFRASEYLIHVTGVDDDHLSHVRARLNAGDPSLYGFFEVDMECDPSTMYPVLPERVSGKNMFSNRLKRELVYYSEEIKFATKRGAKVVKVHAYCLWQKSAIYSKLIKVLKAEKMRGEGKDVEGNVIPGCPKNPALRAAAKLAQNALYGKSLQFINESVQIVDNQEDLFRLVMEGKSDVTIQPIYRSAAADIVEVVVKSKVPRVQKRSCSALGTAILAEARMVLYTYFEEVLRVNGTILYCDTDSIVFTGDTPLPNECIHDSIYGKMKVEIDPKDIQLGGFVALAPKCYAFKLVDNVPYVKCKGINLSSNIDLQEDMEPLEALMVESERSELIDRAVALGEDTDSDEMMTGLSYDNLRSLVVGECKRLVTSQMQFIKTKDRRIAAVDTIKMLKDSFDKRKLLKDNRTVPWTPYNETLLNEIRAMNVGYVSNFFRHGDVGEIHDLVMESDNMWLLAIYNGWVESGEENSLLFKAIYNIW